MPGRTTRTLRGLPTLVALTALAATLAASTGLAEPVHLPKLLALTAGGVAVSGLLLLRLMRRDPLDVPYGFLSAVTGFVTAAVIATFMADSVAGSVLGTYGRWSGLAAYAAAAVLAVAITVSFSLSNAFWMVRILGASTLIAALYGLAQYVGIDPLSWTTPYETRVFSLLGNPNFAAAFIGIGVPIWAWIALGATSFKGRVSAVGALLVHLLVQVGTGSLQGPVVSGIGLATMAFVAMGSLDDRRRSTGRWVISVGSLGLLLVGLAGYLGSGPAAGVNWSTIEIRRRYWKAALDMVRDSPIVGYGFHGYAGRFREYRSVEAWRAVGSKTSNDAAHSVPLEVLASGGLTLFVAFGALILVVSWHLFRAARVTEELDRSRRLLVAAVAGAWAGYLGHAVISIDVPPLLITGWVLAGLSVVLGSHVEQGSRSRRERAPTDLVTTAAVGGLALTVLVSSWLVVRQVRADSDYLAALEIVQQDSPTALALLDSAQTLAPWERRYVQAAGDLLVKGGDPAEALARYEEGLLHHPRSWELAVSAARLAARMGDFERSARHFDSALVLDPNAAEIHVAAAEVALLRGENARSVELLNRAILLEPDRPSWWLFLAEALDAAGSPSDANAARCRALELDPGLQDVDCEPASP